MVSSSSFSVQTRCAIMTQSLKGMLNHSPLVRLSFRAACTIRSHRSSVGISSECQHFVILNGQPVCSCFRRPSFRPCTGHCPFPSRTETPFISSFPSVSKTLVFAMHFSLPFVASRRHMFLLYHLSIAVSFSTCQNRMSYDIMSMKRLNLGGEPDENRLR